MGWCDSRSFCLCGLILLVGCGGSRGPDMEQLKKLNKGSLKELVKVGGQVTVDGESKAGVDIYLHPPGGGPVLKNTSTDAEGKFCWSSFKACDGVEVGEYKVSFAYVLKTNKKGEGDDLLKKRYDQYKSKFNLKVESGSPQEDLKYELTTK